jgi:alpha-ketoglutarate-dependent taurine dioxygenase
VVDHHSTALQPFSPAWISLHREGSRRREGDRPRYLVFQCLGPPTIDQGGQTILRRSADVVSALSPASRAVLRRTILVPEENDTPVLSGAGDAVITFRDPVPDDLEWRSTCEPAELAAALRDLLLAVYLVPAVRGVHWRANRLVVLDNARFLHGRSAGGGDGRELRRVRVR